MSARDEPHGHARRSIAQLVALFLVVGEKAERDRLQRKTDDEDGDGVQDEIEHQSSFLISQGDDDAPQQLFGEIARACDVAVGDAVGQGDMHVAIGKLGRKTREVLGADLFDRCDDGVETQSISEISRPVDDGGPEGTVDLDQLVERALAGRIPLGRVGDEFELFALRTVGA